MGVRAGVTERSSTLHPGERQAAGPERHGEKPDGRSSRREGAAEVRADEVRYPGGTGGRARVRRTDSPSESGGTKREPAGSREAISPTAVARDGTRSVGRLVARWIL